VRRSRPAFPHRPRNRWLFVGAVVTFLGLAVFVFAFLPGLVVDKNDYAEAENDVRSTGVQLLAGLALGLGLLFTAVTLIYNREQQITDRFTNAIEHLGGETTEVRIGGIYALGRIMRDSAEDHGAVVDVLTAFVREHATLPSDDSKPEWIRADVQAALNVLGRRQVRPKHEVDALRMSETNLRGAFLRQAQFSCARLRKANLDHAHLERADLEGAKMPGVSLERADLESANLNFANLVGGVMRKATLRNASLKGAHLAGVTGEPALTEKQREEAHCLWDVQTCNGALAPSHPCAKYDPESAVEGSDR
jgi:Pentapeptide repeats (8 copies)